jgi:hypothetical protein
LEVLHINLAPLARAIRPASRSPSSRKARPVIKIIAGSFLRSTSATRLIVAVSTGAGPDNGGSGAGWPPSFQAQSAGKISVAIWPGGVRAAAIAAAASAPTQAAVSAERTQPETV